MEDEGRWVRRKRPRPDPILGEKEGVKEGVKEGAKLGAWLGVRDAMLGEGECGGRSDAELLL